MPLSVCRPPFRTSPTRPLTPLAGACAALLATLGSATAWAQDAPTAPTLQLTPLMAETVTPEARRQGPTFLEGDRMTGQTGGESTVEGNAVMRRNGTVIHADTLRYDAPSETVRAEGNARVNVQGNVFEGPKAEYNVGTQQGHFEQPRYDILRNGGQGQAERIDLLDGNRAVLTRASYTTCRRQPGPSWLPDWVLNVGKLTINNDKQQGHAENAVLRFKDVPIFAVPSLTFPMGNQRESGFLPPVMGVDNTSGVELTQPYYWNIAPNRDATFYPTLMSRRGLDLGAEFRYLEPKHQGEIRGNVTPSDRIAGGTRWGVLGKERITLNGLAGVDLGAPIEVRADIARVSDDNFWRDYPRMGYSLTPRLLSSQLLASWEKDGWQASAQVQKWQTLQDPTAPIVPPYSRLPQLRLRHDTGDKEGFTSSVQLESTRFVADSNLTLQPNAWRNVALGRVGYRWQTPGSFLQLTGQVHATQYSFDAPIATGATTAQRVLPTVSADAGLIFERDAAYFGRAFRQTLEPRAFYTYTPHRDQSALPVYDTANNNFSFGTVFASNTFLGQDRIADNHALTLGVSTRLIDPAQGTEAVRLSLAQRYRFSPQNVTMPGETPLVTTASDIIAGASVNWTRRWGTDALLQYTPGTGQFSRAIVSARYSPLPYHTLYTAYKMQAGVSEQVTLGWQWPLSDLRGGVSPPDPDRLPGQGLGDGRWYGVGRMNYSLQDKRWVDAIVGLEYDAGCWLARVIYQQSTTAYNSSSKSLMFQLELSGLSGAGNNALRALRDSIPRFQLLRETSTTPSRFTNYD